MQISRIATLILCSGILFTSCDKDSPNPPKDQNENLKKGLIAHYPLNGNTNDISGNNLHGTAIGTIAYAPNKYFEASTALKLDGSNYISVPDDAKLQLKKSMTIYLEFHPETENVACLVSKRNIGDGYQAFNLAINYQSPVVFGVIKKDMCDPNNEMSDWNNLHSELDSPVLPHCWNYVAAIFDGTSQKIYLNGKLVADEAVNFGEMGACTPTDLRIGYWWNSDPIAFEGLIDEVRIYDRALTQDEVRQLYKL